MRQILPRLALALTLASPLPAQDLNGGLAQLPQAAQDDHALAQTLMDQGDLAGALVAAERALAVSTDLLGPLNGTTIFLALDYGEVLDGLGREPDALALYETLYQGVLQTYTEWSPYHAMVTIAYADMLSKVGRNAEALPLALGVTRTVADIFGAETPMTAVFLRDAAQVLRRMGHLDEALEAYRRILPIFDAAGGPDDAMAAASVAFLIADVLDRQGRLEEAATAYADADARMAAARGAEHPETLAVRLGRARLAWAQGDYATINRLLDENLAVVTRIYGEGSLEHGEWLRLQSWVMADAAGDAAAGLPTMEAAVAMIAKALPADHRIVGEARGEYAVLLSFAGQNEAAWEQYQLSEAAAGHDRKFLLDTLGYLVEGGQLDEVSLTEAVLPHLQRIANGPARGAVREQVLRQLIRDPAAAALYREATDMVEERRALEDEIADLASRPLAEADPEREALLRDRLAELGAGIRSRMDEVARLEPGFSALAGEVQLDLPAIQALLEPDEAVVLIDHQRHDQEWSIAVAITRDKAVARTFWVPPEDVNRWATEIRDSVRLTLGLRGAEPLAGAPAAEDRRAFPTEAAEELYYASLGVVDDLLVPDSGPVPHVYVEFRGPMTGIPPGLLMPFQPDPGAAPEDFPYLIRFHAFTVLPDLTALRSAALADAGTRAPEAFAGFADPVFDPDTAEPLLVASAEEVGNSRLRGALVPLPETADEAARVRDTVGGDDGSLWLAEAASEARVKAEPLDHYRMLYFATHGLVSGDRVGGAILSEPALALTPGAGEDGFLTASEIAALKLNADWVVLSACNTAQGDAPGAEALSGLAQAFLYAGARALLVSHWPVESRSAVQLMTDLFRIRAENPGLRAAEAQQQAMIDMIVNPANPDWSHPAYWAPFVIVGNPDQASADD